MTDKKKEEVGQVDGSVSKSDGLVRDFRRFLLSVPEGRVRVTRHDGVAFAVEVLELVESHQEDVR